MPNKLLSRKAMATFLHPMSHNLEKKKKIVANLPKVLILHCHLNFLVKKKKVEFFSLFLTFVFYVFEFFFS